MMAVSLIWTRTIRGQYNSSLVVNAIGALAEIDALPMLFCQQFCSCIAVAIYSTGYVGASGWAVFGYFLLSYSFYNHLWVVFVIAVIGAIYKTFGAK